MNSTVDVVVVGGGPAGLSGALELARAGASVTLLDENVELGGQYYQRRRGEVLRRLGDHRPEGTRLIGEVRAAGVDVRTQNLAWGREGMTLHILDRPSGESTTVECRAILLATGAYERSLPFPGWTLPGVCTPGLALHLSQTHGVAVGRRVVVAGTGPFLLVVATALLEVGAAVEAVVELNRPYRPQLQALGALRDFARLRELAGYFAALRRHRVRIVQGRRLVAATGKDRVEAVTVSAADGGTERIAVDALCVGLGFAPSSELARLFGCPIAYDALTGEHFPVCDGDGQTPIPGVFVAGELIGIAGAKAARTRGRLAGLAAAKELGLAADPARIAAERESARRLTRLAATVNRLYAVPAETYTAIPDGTVVCRCEAVEAGAVRAAASTDWTDLAAVKALTRAGMGTCQGRTCGRAVAALAGRPQEVFTVRMPVKPIPMPLADVAQSAVPEEA